MDNSVSTCTVSGDYIIYKTTNLITNLIYIGKKYLHVQNFKKYLGSGKVLKLAIKKYGRDNFIRETIEYCTSANVDEKEIYWISELSATNPFIGYNITSGGRGTIGYIHTEESKHKICQSLQKNKNGIGNKCSEETKLKISQAQRNKKLSNETKLKISKSKRNKKLSEETRKRMSIAKLGNKSWSGKKLSEEHKRNMSISLKLRHQQKLINSLKGM